MIQIKQIKMPIEHTEAQLQSKVLKRLRITEESLTSFEITKKSIDARKKNDIYYVYTVTVGLKNEAAVLRRQRGQDQNLAVIDPVVYQFPQQRKTAAGPRPIIIGSGPAGLFCAYLLAEQGFLPVIIERGRRVTDRRQDVAGFWAGQRLKLNSNVQFGEGGAGTFSDGKLNTLIKDVGGRCQKVLHTFIKLGAPAEIAYLHKPHIGTDILQTVVKNMREAILAMGGEFLFETCVTDLKIKDRQLQQLVVTELPTGKEYCLETKTAILAIGHSARDTFAMLHQRGLAMEAKAFAVGFRVEHPQEQISRNQYGSANASLLPAADYKLQTKTAQGRGCYSFCMCPGGYVVNASSEEGALAVNGMSYWQRAGENANSAMIVTVTPADFSSEHPLGGMAFQRDLEQRAYALASGAIPQQLFGDFVKKSMSSAYGAFTSTTKGAAAFAPLHELLTADLYEAFIAGMHRFGRQIEGFDRPDCILSGIESRTSSPVRILRGTDFMSNIKGIYPCGEGAGYAGGIMSAAIDGMKTAEAIAGGYQ